MGMPAARVTDNHVCPMVTALVPHVGGPIIPPCAITVITAGMIQARVTDMLVCVGPPDIIAKGSAGVMVCKLPAARMLDTTAHGGIIMGPCAPTVLIGESSAGSANAGNMVTVDVASGAAAIGNAAAQAKAFIGAHKSAAHFCRRCAE